MSTRNPTLPKTKRESPRFHSRSNLYSPPICHLPLAASPSVSSCPQEAGPRQGTAVTWQLCPEHGGSSFCCRRWAPWKQSGISPVPSLKLLQENRRCINTFREKPKIGQIYKAWNSDFSRASRSHSSPGRAAFRNTVCKLFLPLEKRRGNTFQGLWKIPTPDLGNSTRGNPLEWKNESAGITYTDDHH